MKIQWEGLCPHCHKPIKLIRELPDDLINVIKQSPQATTEATPGQVSPIAWEVVRPILMVKFNAKEPYWYPESTVLKRLGEVGADLSSKRIETSYNTLDNDGKQAFLKLLEGS